MKIKLELELHELEDMRRGYKVYAENILKKIDNQVMPQINAENQRILKESKENEKTDISKPDSGK